MATTAAISNQSASWEDHAKVVFEELNEKQRRWVAGMMSEMLGWGGTKRMANLTGMDPKTVRQGRIDLQTNLDALLRDGPSDRIRREGGGRPPLEKKIRTFSEIECFVSPSNQHGQSTSSTR